MVVVGCGGRGRSGVGGVGLGFDLGVVLVVVVDGCWFAGLFVCLLVCWFVYLVCLF